MTGVRAYGRTGVPAQENFFLQAISRQVSTNVASLILPRRKEGAIFRGYKGRDVTYVGVRTSLPGERALLVEEELA